MERAMEGHQWLPPTPPPPASHTEPRLGAPDEPPQGPIFEERRSLLRRVGAGLAAIGVAIAKFFAQFKAVLLLLPKLKLLTTSGSMLVSVGAYSLIWGWTFAIGFVILLFVHEMGHVIQLRREGIPASAPLFIPFLGAAVGMKRMPDNALAEARVGLAGPILGSLGAAVVLLIYGLTHNDYWRALAFVGFFLNLINLLPVLPLDGGRAMAAMSPWMWFVGFAGLIALVFITPSPILILVVLFGAMETVRRWRLRRDPEHQAYYKVPPAGRIGVAIVYLGLIAALAYGMHVSHLVRHFSDV
jgi:Zn-dependent protease